MNVKRPWRKAAKKAQRALAGYDARMEAAIANLEKERAPLAFDFDDTRRSLNEAESADKTDKQPAAHAGGPRGILTTSA